MACQRLNHEDLYSLAAGGLPVLKAWQIRRHISHCIDCRSEWQAVTEIWARLRTGSAPPPDYIWNAIAEAVQFAPAKPVRKTITIGGYTMSRSGAAITAAAIVCIVTGTLANNVTHWFDFRARLTFWDSRHRAWNVATSADVKIEVDDSSGQQFGVGGNEGRVPTNDPVVEVRVAWVDATIRGMGRHEIRDAAGRLLGAVILSGWSTSERARMDAQSANFIPPRDYDAFVAWSMQRDKASGGGRGDSMGPIAWGDDGDSGLFWCARGLGSIDLGFGSATLPHIAGFHLAPLPPIARTLSPAAYSALDFSGAEIAIPRLTVTVNGKRTDYHGYGVFTVPLEGGKTVTFRFKKPVAGLRPGLE